MYIMETDDMIYEMGTFLTTKELFIYSRVSQQWNKNLLIHKKKRMKQIKEHISTEHYCSNLCPCILESLFEKYMTDFFLKRHICRMLLGKRVPNWVLKLIDEKSNDYEIVTAT